MSSCLRAVVINKKSKISKWLFNWGYNKAPILCTCLLLTKHKSSSFIQY